MENKFKIGQEVFVSGTTQKMKTIIDVENFEDLTLYYMNDGSAYPEKMLYIDSKVAVIRELMSLSDEERYKRVSDFFGLDD